MTNGPIFGGLIPNGTSRAEPVVDRLLGVVRFAGGRRRRRRRLRFASRMDRRQRFGGHPRLGNFQRIPQVVRGRRFDFHLVDHLYRRVMPAVVGQLARRFQISGVDRRFVGRLLFVAVVVAASTAVRIAHPD